VTPFLIWWGISLGMAAIVSFIKLQPTGLSYASIDQTTKRELKFIIGAYLAIMLINFMLYPLLPEGDGYFVLVKWASIQANPKLFTSDTRGLFLVFLNLSSTLLKIDPYWIFKVFLPLSHIAIVLSCYIFGRSFIPDSRYRILLSLSPLFFPVVLQEILISRPQSILLISFLPSLAIVSDTLGGRQNIRQVYWLLALFTIGLIGMKIHTLFAFIAFVSVLSIVIFLKKEIFKRPLDSFIIALSIFVLLFPQISKTRILSDSWDLIKLFAISLRNGHFDIWFIDHYRNVDGVELGWPGMLSLFYYGYNLGLVLPLLLLLSVARKKTTQFKQLFAEKYWAVIFLFAFFFFIAEIAPRFQLAYLPDRAWLFLALILSLLIPLMVMGLKKSFGPRFVNFLAVICFLSIAAGSGLTYAKQGWVTLEEVKAADFIRTQTPKGAVFLGPGSTGVMVRYYGKRFFEHPADPVFLSGDKDALMAYLKDQEKLYQSGIDEVQKRRLGLHYKLNEIARESVKPSLTDAQLMEFLETLGIYYGQKSSFFVDQGALVDLYPSINRPVYLVYNKNKFSSLYGTRAWWRTSNFYGANIERLNENYPVVYNKNGVIIWEAIK
jgi:hypothetical protein